ncbi:uncharacterized protein G2W53_001020 [Senna tora]|uniref:Uncharacterized protein n=1 Tax=Senna tora TaxID=362788 RepID=A0A834XGP9_9FABA|nr:uncharacterized protein G2W53_001020 [Senna tora]
MNVLVSSREGPYIASLGTVIAGVPRPLNGSMLKDVGLCLAKVVRKAHNISNPGPCKEKEAKRRKVVFAKETEKQKGQSVEEESKQNTEPRCRSPSLEPLSFKALVYSVMMFGEQNA